MLLRLKFYKASIRYKTTAQSRKKRTDSKEIKVYSTENTQGFLNSCLTENLQHATVEHQSQVGKSFKIKSILKSIKPHNECEPRSCQVSRNVTVPWETQFWGRTTLTFR